jgi:polysaccharide biosynthesis transport protein
MSSEASTADDHAFTSAKGSSSVQTFLSKPVGRYRWLTALAMGVVLAACAGAVVMYFYRPQYEATALLQIEDAIPYVAFVPSETGNESQRNVQSQIELLRSTVVLEPVLCRPEIATLPELSAARDGAQYLRDHMTIKRVGASPLYAVAYKSASPQAAATLVNAIMKEYLNIQAGDEFQRTQRIVDVLEEERRRRGLEVERLRQHVLDLSGQATGKDPFDHEATLAADDLDSHAAVLRERLMDIDLDREALEAQNRYLLEQGAAKNEHGDASAGTNSDPDCASEIFALQAANKDSQSIIEQIKQTDAKWSENPLYVRLDKSVKGQRAALDTINKLMSEWPPGERFDRGEKSSENSIAANKLKLAGLDAQRQLLSRQLEETVKSQMSRQGKIGEREFVRGELSREEKVYELYTNRKLALQTESRAPSRVSLRQKATVPGEPDARLPYNQLAIACSAALLAPFAITIAFRQPTRDVQQDDGAT